jgi:hypothetical protein
MALMTVAAVVVSPEAARATGPGAIRLVSKSATGAAAANGASSGAVTSASGEFVAFQSTATNLVPGQSDPNGAGSDVFLFERATGTMRLVSHAAASPSTTGNGPSSGASISADGAFVAFTSAATDLAQGQVDINLANDVFLFERATGTVTLVSHQSSSSTTTGLGASGSAAVSANGAVVTFVSTGANLVAGQSDLNASGDVFAYERATGTVTLVSHVPGEPATAANGASGGPSISADGGFVAFQSGATNLVPGQANNNGTGDDVFLFERATGTMTLVSHVPGDPAATANGASGTAVISADGGSVAFQSGGTNLLTGQSDSNGASDDVFLFDRLSGAVVLVSHTSAGATTTANGRSFSPVISANGGFVAFQSGATNMVAGQSDTNGNNDVFLYDRATGGVALVSHVPGGSTTTGNGFSCCQTISADGGFVAFQSTASNLVAGQADAGFSSGDAFLYQRSTGTTTLVSHTAAGAATTGNASSFSPVLSADGAFVLFGSISTNLVTGYADTNGAGDVFLFQRVATAHAGADFDRDGHTDVSVFRPGNSYWFLHNGSFVQFGTTGDIPVPGDYDGDGDTDIAVFRPSNGVWFIQGGATVAFGTQGDIPVPGDYDGDGDTDIAVFRPSSGVWFVNGGPTVAWGTSGDIPVPGDYDGDGDTDIAVFRQTAGLWLVNGGLARQFGNVGDIPVPGDYDGDRRTDIAVFRPGGGYWFIEGAPIRAYGTAGDVPLPLPDAIRRFFFPAL